MAGRKMSPALMKEESEWYAPISDERWFVHHHTRHHGEMTKRHALTVPAGVTAAKRKAEDSPDDETYAKRIKSSESPLPELATTKDAPRAVPFPEKVRIT